jgi:small subunit ribosomal protein S27e
MEAKKSWIKVKCHECGNEQIIFSRVSMEVPCTKCSATLAVPTGGKSAIKAEIVELL